MANCSNFELTLTGHPFQLKQARDELVKHQHEFNLREIYDEQFTHEPPTWNLQGEGRWGVYIENLIDFLEPYNLSGTLVDVEPGSNFFHKVCVENGIVLDRINDDYVSDAHYEHCPDTCYWFDQLDYALDEPEQYSNQIEFMLKHNIITQEYLQECIQKHKSNQQ